MSNIWQVQEARARFSELLEASLAEGPQIVTKRGKEAAVLVPIEQWRKLERLAKPSPEGIPAGPRAAYRGVNPAEKQAAAATGSKFRVEECCVSPGTNVVSELRRSRPHAAVLNWIQGVPEEQLYLSAVTIGEI